MTVPQRLSKSRTSFKTQIVDLDVTAPEGPHLGWEGVVLEDGARAPTRAAPSSDPAEAGWCGLQHAHGPARPELMSSLPNTLPRAVPPAAHMH